MGLIACIVFSGAGKTVSATHIMRYFATADDKESGKIKDATQGMTEVEEQIMGKNRNRFRMKTSNSLLVKQLQIQLWKHSVTQKPQEIITVQDSVNILR